MLLSTRARTLGYYRNFLFRCNDKHCEKFKILELTRDGKCLWWASFFVFILYIPLLVSKLKYIFLFKYNLSDILICYLKLHHHHQPCNSPLLDMGRSHFYHILYYRRADLAYLLYYIILET